MYSSGASDAHATGPSNASDFSSSMHVDHSFVWDRQLHSRDKVERGDRVRSTPGKRDCFSDRAVSSLSFQRSASGFSAVGGVFGIPSKRRPVGWYSAAAGENRRSVSERTTTSSLFSGNASPVENCKTERNIFNASGSANSPSPGYSGNSAAEQSNKGQDEHLGRDHHASLVDGLQAASPVLDHAYGTYRGSISHESSCGWEHEKSKVGARMGSDLSQRTDRDMREWLSMKPEVHRRSGSLPKLDSGRDWGLGDKKLEGRLDRYGRILNRECKFADALVGSKEYTRPDGRKRDRAVSSTVSSWGSAYLSGDISSKDTHLQVHTVSDVSVATSSPQHSPHLTSSVLDSGCGRGVNASPRKRPRLGWGQGLAQYEKEKVEVDDPSPLIERSGKPTDGNVLFFCADGLGEGDQSRTSPQPCGSEVGSAIGVQPPANFSCENMKKTTVESGCLELPSQFDIKNDSKGVQDHCVSVALKSSISSENADKENDLRNMEACPSNLLPEKHSALLVMSSVPATLSESSCPCDMQTVTNDFWVEGMSKWSKEMIMQQVEKVEHEIDLIEKELVKLEKICDKEESRVKGEWITSREAKDQRGISVPVALGISVPAAFSGSTEPPTASEKTLSLDHIDEGSPYTCAQKEPSSSYGILRPGGNDQSTLLDHTCLDEVAVKVSGVGDNACEVQGSHQDSVVEELPRIPLEQGGIKVPEENAQKFIPNFNTGAHLRCLTDLISCDGKEPGQLISPLILANRKLANCSFEPLAHLLGRYVADGKKLYSSPEEASFWQLNLLTHDRNKKYLVQKVTEKKRFHGFKEQVLALKYRILRESWKQDQFVIGRRRDCTMALRGCEIRRGKGSIPPSQRSLRLRPGSTFSTRSDAVLEEVRVVQKLLNEPAADLQRAFSKMPPMALDDTERKFHSFISSNGLVEDPVAVEQERKVFNPWSAEEKKIFLGKYSAFGKNFSKIASFLQHKTVADCVEFYYRNQKSEEFEKPRRRQQLKKRRDYSRATASYLATTTSVSSRHREVNAAHVEGLLMVAAVSAAVPKDFTKVVRSNSNKMAERASLVSAESGCSENQELAKVLCGKENNSDTVSVAADISAVVASSCTVTSACMENLFEKDSAKQGSMKSNNAERHTGKRAARSVHAHSLKADNEESDSQWTDYERDLFTRAVAIYGKDFKRVSLHIGSKSPGQCKAFFSKARKRLDLDQMVQVYHSTLQSCSGSGAQEGKQREGLEHLKSTHIFEEGSAIEPVSEPASLAAMEEVDAHLERIEPQLCRLDEGETCMEDSRTTWPGSLLEAVDNVAEPLNDTDQELSSRGIAVRVEEGSSMQQVESKTNYANRTMLCTPFYSQQEESEPLADEGKPAEDFQELEDLSKEPTPEAIVSVVQSEGTVCTDMSESIARQGKVESESALLGIQGLADSASILPVAPAAAVVSTSALVTTVGTTVATCVVENVQVKEKGFKGMFGGDAKPRREPTSWTQEEKERFADIIRKHGKNWALLNESLPAKSLTQIKTYFKNSKAKLGFTPEGTGGGSGRGFLARKHKADELEVCNIAGSVRQMGQENVFIHSDEAGLKVDKCILGSRAGTAAGFGRSMGGAETLAYGSLFGKNSSQVRENAVGAQKMFHTTGVTQNQKASGILPILHPAALSVFTPSNFQQVNNESVQQSQVHSKTLKSQLMLKQHHHQQQQQSSAPVIVQQSQQQAQSVVIQQQSQVMQQQQDQAVAGSQLDMQKQVVQHLQKQTTQQQQQHQQASQVFLHQQQQEVAHQLQQQVTHVALQQQQQLQSQVLQCQQQVADQVPHHLLQVMHYHLDHLQKQSSNHALSQQQQVINQQQALTNHLQQVSNQQKGGSQQQACQSSSQLFQLHTKQQALPHHPFVTHHQQQQQAPQQLLQQEQLHLHLHQQQMQFKRQHHQAHPQHQSQSQHLQKQISQTHPSFDFLHEHYQQQQQGQLVQPLDLLRDVTQMTNAVSDAVKQSDSELCKSSRFKRSACEDPHQSQVTSQPLAQPSSKVESSEAQFRVGDVKLFGQSLLSQPLSCASQTSTNSFGTQTNLPQAALSAATTSTSSTSNAYADVLSENHGAYSLSQPSAYGTLGGAYLQGQGRQFLWPGKSGASGYTTGALVSGSKIETLSRVVNVKPEPGSVQEAVPCITERFIAKELEDNHILDSLPILSQEMDNSDLAWGAKEQKSLLKVIRNSEHVGVVEQTSNLTASRHTEYKPVMDALMTLAEWRLQHTSGSSGKLEDFLSQSLESLRRDSSCVLESEKTCGPLGIAGSWGESYMGLDFLQRLRDGIYLSQPHLMQLQGCAGVGSVWGPSHTHQNDFQHILAPRVPSFHSHGLSCNPSGSDERARAESRDSDTSGGAVG